MLVTGCSVILLPHRNLYCLFICRVSSTTDAPKLKLVLGGGVRSGDIREGRDVYLECEITAKPAAHEIVWYFEGTTELHTDKDKGTSRNYRLHRCADPIGMLFVTQPTVFEAVRPVRVACWQMAPCKSSQGQVYIIGICRNHRQRFVFGAAGCL